MNPLIALVLGIVEGLTEYLPVSSTGHLILVGNALGAKGDAADAFEIVIQLGAVLAVVVHYRELLGLRLRGLLVRDPAALRLVSGIAIAFLPMAVVGLLFRKAIKANLFGPVPVASALIVGGVLMIAVERIRRAKKIEGVSGLENVTPKRALAIGIGQCFALFPGASRSMSTILAGQFAGLSTATAAEFSFLVAIPTLGAATVYEGYKSRHELASSIGAVNVGIGLVVSFFVAWGVISAFLRYLQRRGLEPFGYYRIVLGIVVFVATSR
jgi:undecaprenyl-diphosphatase